VFASLAAAASTVKRARIDEVVIASRAVTVVMALLGALLDGTAPSWDGVRRE